MQHLALYAKGWYKTYHPLAKRKTLWDDLKTILEMEGYPSTMDKKDVYHIILNFFVRTFPNKLEKIIKYANPVNSWEVGYVVNHPVYGNKENVYEYEMAVMMAILNEIRLTDSDEFQITTLPDYSQMPRKNGIKNKYLKRFENENILSRTG